jgi:hypothetical protein
VTVDNGAFSVARHGSFIDFNSSQTTAVANAFDLVSYGDHAMFVDIDNQQNHSFGQSTGADTQDLMLDGRRLLWFAVTTNGRAEEIE